MGAAEASGVTCSLSGAVPDCTCACVCVYVKRVMELALPVQPSHHNPGVSKASQLLQTIAQL